MRGSFWFLTLSGVYFLIQALQRTWLGGTLEVDEAEMLVMAQGWALGYGPQLPLYNWAQVLVFQVTGPGTAGIAFLKDAVLWLAAAGMWFGMRAAFADRRAAAAAALSLAFLPNVIWEFQRASSHSIALLAAVTWTLWAWFVVRERPTWQNWLMLGLIMGLGGLSKANYWAVPLGLAVASIGYWPRARGAILSVLVAAVIVTAPYYWAVTHPADSLASVHKFYQDAPVIWPWVSGLGLLAGSTLAGLLLPLIIGGALWLFAARGRLGAMPEASRILLRAAALNLGVAALLVVVFGVTRIQARWLVPMLVFAAAAGFGWLGRGLSTRSFRALPVLAMVCAGVTVLGMAQVRQGATATLDFAPLVALVDRMNPTRVEGDFYTAGNLKLLDPARDVGTLGSGGWPDRLMILGQVPNLPTGISVLDGGVLDLPYADKPDKRFPVEWHMVGR